MGVQSIIDSFDLISPGFSHMFDSFGSTDYLGIRPTESQKAGYYTAMALTFITPGGAEVGAEKFAVKGLGNLAKSVKMLPEAFSKFSRFEYHFAKHSSEWEQLQKLVIINVPYHYLINL